MSRDTYQKVIIDQKEEINLRAGEVLVRRESESRISPNSQLVQIITGVRRSGKSTLAHQLYSNLNYAYLNFDDERLMSCSPDDLNLLN